MRFNRLLALTNLPIKRFGSTLVSKGQFDDYMLLLKGAFVADNLEGVMCRDLLSVDTEQWRKEMGSLGDYLASYGSRLPDELGDEYDAVVSALENDKAA